MTTMTMSNECHNDNAGASAILPAGWWLVPAVLSGGSFWVWAITAILG